MTWYAWVMVVALGVAAIAPIDKIGKQRDRLKPEDVIARLILLGLLIWGIVALAGHGC